MNVTIKQSFAFDGNKQEETDKDYKIVLLGDPNVGKTCLIRRLVNDTFPFVRGFGSEPYHPTVGIDFYKRIFTFPPTAYRTTGM